MSEERGCDCGRLLVAFLAGAATGAAVALLASPKSGPELRAAIGDGVDDLRDRVGGAVGSRLEKAGAVLEAAGARVRKAGRGD